MNDLTNGHQVDWDKIGHASVAFLKADSPESHQLAFAPFCKVMKQAPPRISELFVKTTGSKPDDWIKEMKEARQRNKAAERDEKRGKAGDNRKRRRADTSDHIEHMRRMRIEHTHRTRDVMTVCAFLAVLLVKYAQY
jgi:hypothetical protein